MTPDLPQGRRFLSKCSPKEANSPRKICTFFFLNATFLKTSVKKMGLIRSHLEKGSWVGWGKRCSREKKRKTFSLHYSVLFWVFKNETRKSCSGPGMSTWVSPALSPSPLPELLQLGGSIATHCSSLFHKRICLLKQRPSWKIPTAFISILIIGSRGGARVPWHTTHPKSQDESILFLQGWPGSRLAPGELQTVFKIFHSFPRFPDDNRLKRVKQKCGEKREKQYFVQSIMDHAANGSQPRTDSQQIVLRDFFLTLRLPSEGM